MAEFLLGMRSRNDLRGKHFVNTVNYSSEYVYKVKREESRIKGEILVTEEEKIENRIVRDAIKFMDFTSASQFYAGSSTFVVSLLRFFK